jgi:hypothetical protein
MLSFSGVTAMSGASRSGSAPRAVAALNARSRFSSALLKILDIRL